MNTKGSKLDNAREFIRRGMELGGKTLDASAREALKVFTPYLVAIVVAEKEAASLTAKLETKSVPEKADN